MAYMIKKLKKLMTTLKRRSYNITAVVFGAVFLGALFFSLRLMNTENILVSDVRIFALFFIVFFFVLLVVSILIVFILNKLDVRPGIFIISLFTIPFIIPPDITAVIFDLFFSPRDGFIAYLGDKYNIDILNNMLLDNYSVFIFSFVAYSWKMMVPLLILFFVFTNKTSGKNIRFFIYRILFLLRSIPVALILYVAFIHQIPIIMKCYVSRYEYVYTFPDCFTPEIFPFIYSAVLTIVAVMLLFSVLLSKRARL